MSVHGRDEVFERVEKILLTKLSVVISRAEYDELRENGKGINGAGLTPKRRALQERPNQRRATPGICSFVVRANEKDGWVNVCACASHIVSNRKRLESCSSDRLACTSC